MTQQLPPAGYRVCTGSLRIGDDWQGYFIRGDEAAGKAVMLRYCADKLKQTGSEMHTELTRFADELDSVQE